MRAGWVRVWLAAMTVLGSSYGLAQDTRTVTEPVFPPVCTVLSSQMALVAGQPASETAFDTTRIQSALTACGSGNAVELAASGTNYAFLIQPLNIPSGVSLIVDGGVTVFASRNPADYQVGTVSSTQDQCGTDGVNGNGCKNLILFNNNSTNVNSGIYGYGVIDGRGYANMLVNGADSGLSWWQNADNYVSPQSQNNPIMMKLSKSTNFTLYKITLRSSPEFHVGWSGTGFTAWGVKIQAPYTAHNTDGIDPVGSNITIVNSSISDGDDNIAVGASSASSNITIQNVTTYSGHGVSVGSYTQGGLTNMLVDHVNMAGTGADGNATGIRLKSAQDRGGLLQNITYQNMCLKDMRHILQFTPFYNTNAGTLIPQFKNVTLQNIHFLTPSTGAYAYLVQMQGHDANYPESVTLNNVVFDSLLATNVTPATQYTNFTLAGNVYPAFLQSLPGTGVTYTGTATSTATGGAFSCPATVFPYVVGELYLSTATATSLQTVSLTAPASVTLNAMVQPAMSQQTYNGTAGKYTGAAALTNPINFLEGTNVVGTGTLGANGTIASLTLTGVTTGTHTYTAQYPADANYAALSFGSVTVNVSAATAVATTTTLTATGAGGTYGGSTALTATVAPASGSNVPTGQVQFLDGTTVVATATLTAGSTSTTQVFGGGSHSITAKYLSDANDLASTSAANVFTVTTATPSVGLTATPGSVSYGSATVLSAQLTGVTSGSTPTGTVTFYDGSSSVGNGSVSTSGLATLSVTPTTVGTHSYTASYGGDTNYATKTSAATVVTVAQATTTTTLTAAPASVAYGTGTVLSATVSTTTGTGSVKFMDGANVLATVTLNAGTASTTQVLGGGSHSLTAVYTGDTNFAGSTSVAAAATVLLATPATMLTASPTTVLLGSSTTLTATFGTVAGGVAPTGTVTFKDGTATIGAGTLSAAGVATLSAALTTAGPHSITAVYGGDGNYAATTSAVATVTATTVSTTTTLTIAPATSYVGGSVLLTATVGSTSGVPSGTVTFANASGTLGTGTLNANGVATLTAAETSAGVQQVTASFAANGGYLASASAAGTLTVVAPVVLSASTSAASLAAGGSTTVTFTAVPGGGFTGAVAFTCASPVSYVSCTLAPASQTVSGTASVQSIATISVASSVAAIPQPARGWYALLMPLGLLAFAGRRRGLRLLALLLVIGGLAGGLSGCGGASTSSGSTTKLPPAGTQTVTVTAVAAGVSATASVVVTVTN